MTDRKISIAVADAMELYGVNNSNVVFLSQLFPSLKLIARGTELRVMGDEEQTDAFAVFFERMQNYLQKFGRLRTDDILRLWEEDARDNGTETALEGDIILYGRDGKVIRSRTPNQLRMLREVEHNDMVFAIGPAGTGKTYTAVALAVRALKNKEIKRIILTRPAVEAGENLGFLPGDMRDKLDPYLQPLYDALRDMLPPQRLLSYMEDRTIEIAPLAFMRGRTLDHAYVILDEAQNATSTQLKMFLTRMGENAKFFITGDVTQIDLPRHQQSGLMQATRILKDIPGISVIFMNQTDIVRHRLVTSVVNAYAKQEAMEAELRKEREAARTEAGEKPKGEDACTA
ncbi:MAG: PhoH family protein [Bacteroidales bacterium]|nr:PhoH family protein [Bacteroidales bacterium]